MQSDKIIPTVEFTNRMRSLRINAESLGLNSVNAAHCKHHHFTYLALLLNKNPATTAKDLNDIFLEIKDYTMEELRDLESKKSELDEVGIDPLEKSRSDTVFEPHREEDLEYGVEDDIVPNIISTAEQPKSILKNTASAETVRKNVRWTDGKDEGKF